MSAVRLQLPFPPSVNHYWRHAKGMTYISGPGKSYRKNVIAITFGQLGSPLSGALRADVALYPNDRRQRDLDNHLKSLFDALTHAGIFHDDEQIKSLGAEWGCVRKPGYALVVLSGLVNWEPAMFPAESDDPRTGRVERWQTGESD